MLYKYALFLAEKKLYTQAVIALQVAVETKIIMRFSDPKNIGDYEKLQEIKDLPDYKTLRDEFKTYRRNTGNKHSLGELEGVRNQIAHGGGNVYLSQIDYIMQFIRRLRQNP